MKLADWRDKDAAVDRLISRGMSPQCAAAASPCFAQAADTLQTAGINGDTAVVACWSPGRIEVFGKHTDYCGGDSILATAERGFCFLAAPRIDANVHFMDARRGEACDFPIESNLTPRLGHWSNYPQTVVRRLARNFPQARRGATIAFASNLPASSGMSSSSAFVVGMFLLLSQINELERDPTYVATIHGREDLAGYLGTVENGASFGPLAGDRGVGTFGGSEDHTAILCGQPNRLVQYGYCPVRFRRSIELADDYVFAIASSGVVAEKTGAALKKYNRIAAMVRTIVSTWQSASGRDEQSLAAILASLHGDSAKLRDFLVAHTDAAIVTDLVERLYHFSTESSLIDAVPDTIDASTVCTFGEAAYESHSMAHLHLKNQTAETNRLVEIAESLGAPAASAFGAGFGGSVWALVERSQSAQFLDDWRTLYVREFQQHADRAQFFLTRPNIPAIVCSEA